MQQRERAWRTRFDSIMSRYEGEERRALADLHTLGFQFRSIEAARRFRNQQYKQEREGES